MCLVGSWVRPTHPITNTPRCLSPQPPKTPNQYQNEPHRVTCNAQELVELSQEDLLKLQENTTVALTKKCELDRFCSIW